MSDLIRHQNFIFCNILGYFLSTLCPFFSEILVLPDSIFWDFGTFDIFNFSEILVRDLNGHPDPSHFIFEFNVKKRRIRLRACGWMMNFYINIKSIPNIAIQIQSRTLSDTTLSDMDFKYQMAWLPLMKRTEIEQVNFGLKFPAITRPKLSGNLLKSLFITSI